MEASPMRIIIRFVQGSEVIAVFADAAVREQMRTDWAAQTIATYDVLSSNRGEPSTPCVLMVRWPDVLFVS